MKSLYAFALLFIVPALIFGAAGEKNKPEHKVEFTITGMTCSECASKVEDAIRGDKDVSAVEVDWKKGTATVTFKKELAKDDYKTFFSRIAKAGFKLEHIKESDGDIYGVNMTCCGPQMCRLDSKNE